jgi:sialidase-1
MNYKRFNKLGMLGILLLLMKGLLAQQNTGPEKWHGFQKQSFKIDTTSAYIVVPEKPLPGNPWLWRTYSPEFHIEIDSILVTKGFHIGFINVNSKYLYGQPDLMKIWGRFYQTVVNEKKLSPKPALSGAVRGSLCEFAWAKLYPERVSCIYAENPVAEIKSWPGAKMKGVGASPDQWKQLLSSYGFTEEQALAYNDNPKDNLEKLAAQKIPLFFTFGLKDAMIPMEENAFVIADAYIRQGGPVMIYPMTKGKQEQNGHHVTIEQPEAIADFIIRAWQASK